MSFYLYSDIAHSNLRLFGTASLPQLTMSYYGAIDFNNSKISDPTLGDIYGVKDRGVTGLGYTFWENNLQWIQLTPYNADSISDLYTTNNYCIHIGVTKTGDGVYNCDKSMRVFKPDGSTWFGGLFGTITINAANENKQLKIGILSYKIDVGGVIRNCSSIILYNEVLLATTPPKIVPHIHVEVCLSDNFFALNKPDPTGGIPQQPEGGNGTFSAPSDTITPMTAGELSTAMGGGGITASGHGIHAYELSSANVSEFLQKIYGQGTDTFSDLWQQFQNYQYDPMSGIIGALILPCTATGTGVPAVTLSGQGIIITGGVKAITDRFANTNLCIIDCTNKVYDSFMDFEPYTKGTLYLPFIGNVAVNVNEFMYGYIEIYYTIDICTGNCVAFVTMRDKNNVHTQYTYSGNCGTPVPISGNDRGISALINGTAGIFGGAVSLGAGIGLGNAGLAAKGVLGIASGAAQIGTRQEQEKHTGGFGGGTGCMGYLTPFLMLNRPVVSTPDDYTARVGRMANQSGSVGDYSGYSVFDWVDVSGISGATDSEKAEIENILKSGIFL